jgi:prolyl oligopeptidase
MGAFLSIRHIADNVRPMTPSPETSARRDDLVETIHGTEVADPYRWLEETDAPETRAWITSQNERSDAWLAQVPSREEIRQRVAEIWDHPRHGAPWRRGDRWFQMRNDGLQDQDVQWVMEKPGEQGWPLVDPNALSKDGTVALTGAAVSDDGRLIAYGTSGAGSDWMTWQVRDVETGEDLPDRVEWSKFSGAAWLPDASGFLYGAYDPPATGEAYEAENKNQRLMLHRLGTDQDEDRLVIARPDQPKWGFGPAVTDDGRFVVVHVWHGTERENRLWVIPLRDDGKLDEDVEIVPLVDVDEAMVEYAGSVGETFYLLTDRDAPRGRVVAVDLSSPAPEDWRDVVPEGADTIERARIVGGRLVVVALHHANHRVRVVDLEGEAAHEVDLPGLVTVEEITGKSSDPVLHLTAESFTAPRTVLSHDVTTAETRELHPPGLDVDPATFVTDQVFVESDDGTRVPVFLVHRRDVDPEGNIPTLLYGYGGFNIAQTPAFKVERLVWVERGGLLAVACLRGGGEYGKEWHDAGRLKNKQNVFDDFAACAEWLAGESGWTRPERIGIHGRSNGGLLVGACMTQRPELYGACVPEVGVLDMLRFHKFTIGWGWISDYGDPDDSDDFATALAYSPYHNVRDGACYPATLVTTGDHDDRVVPGHSFKFTAALQHAQGCDNPILARIDTAAGHGVGKPTSKLVDERTDVLAFLTATVGSP